MVLEQIDYGVLLNCILLNLKKKQEQNLLIILVFFITSAGTTSPTTMLVLEHIVGGKTVYLD